MTAKTRIGKEYTKTDAKTVIDNIIGAEYQDKTLSELKPAELKRITSKLYIGLNTAEAGKRAGVALGVADMLIDSGYVYDEFADVQRQEAIQVVDAMKKYQHNINLDDARSEIKNRYDSDYGTIMALWHNEKGMNIEDVISEIERNDGIYIASESLNVYDKTLAFIKKYKNSLEIKNDKEGKKVSETFTAAEIQQLRQTIAREVLDAYESKGKLTVFSNIVNQYKGKISVLKERLSQMKDYAKASNSMLNTVRRLKDLEVSSADRKISAEFKPITKAFAAIVGTDIPSMVNLENPSTKQSDKIRTAMKLYSKKFTSEDGKTTTPLYTLLMDVQGTENPFAEHIEIIANGTGKLTVDEIKAVSLILKNYIHNAKEYGRVLIAGQGADAKLISEQGITESTETQKRKMSGIASWWNKYTQWVTSPVWVFRRMGNYKADSVAMKFYDEIVNGVRKGKALEQTMQEHFKPFFEKYGKQAEKWAESNIDFAGNKISKGQALGLYMLSLREQAQSHLYNVTETSGTLRITDEKSVTGKDKFLNGKDISFTKSDVDVLIKQFTEAEKEFIKLTQQFFSTLSKDAVNDTYNSLFGVEIADEEAYYPIYVSNDTLWRSIGTDPADGFKQMFNARNPSFIKPLSRNPSNKLVIDNIMNVVNKHMHDVTLFAGLAMPVCTISRVMNANKGALRQAFMQVNPTFENYLDKLLKDVQGMNTEERTTFNAVVGKIRGMGARAALGLNPKVWMNQFVSLFASHGIGMEYKNIFYGLTQMKNVLGKESKAEFDLLYKYSPVAYARARDGSNIDVGLLKEGMGILGKADKLTELSTMPIQKIDNAVVYGVWQSALKQTESQHKPKSEEHYKAAAALLEKALAETQANYTAVFRPEILRTNNELLRLSTMFMSEPLQAFSQLAGNVDALLTARWMKKNATTAEQRTEADALMKKSLIGLKNAAVSTTVAAILLSLITQMANWLKNNKKEEEEKVFLEEFGKDILNNYTGMFPFIRDFQSYLQGYDLSNMYESGLTNLFKAMTDISSLVSGTDDPQKKVRSALIGTSQMFGIPLRNLENYTMGTIQKFSPATAFRYNNMFYTILSDKQTMTYNAGTQSGIPHEVLYTAIKAIPKIPSVQDKDGKTIEGSKKKNVYKYIAGLTLTKEQKLFLIMASGYTVQDNEFKGLTAVQAKKLVANYIKSLDMSTEEKAQIAESIGFTVSGTKIKITA